MPLRSLYGQGSITKSWVSDIKTNAEKFTRARQNKDHYLNNLQSVKANAEKYYSFIGEKMPKELKEAIAIFDGDTSEIGSKVSAFTGKELDRQRKQNQIAKKRRENEQREALIKWRAGEIDYISRAGEYDYLRVKNDRVQTSQGTEMGLQYARQFWRMIQYALDGKDYQTLLGFRVLDRFEVRELTSEFILIGCHKIPHSEINNIAVSLEWRMPEKQSEAA